MVRLGILRTIDQKVLKEIRGWMMLLILKESPPLREGMCLCILQVHSQNVMLSLLTWVLLFI